MKLFTKISLIAAAVSLGVGVLGICIGLAMGANIHDLENIGIYISPNSQIKIHRYTEDDMEDMIEEWYEHDDWDEFEDWEEFDDWEEFEHRHRGKHL